MIKLLHFADAHIDIANYGRHDPLSGLPMRVMAAFMQKVGHPALEMEPMM